MTTKKEWPKPYERLVDRPDAALPFINRLVGDLCAALVVDRESINEDLFRAELAALNFGQVAYAFRQWIKNGNQLLPTPECLLELADDYRTTMSPQPEIEKPAPDESPVASQHRRLFSYQAQRLRGAPVDDALEAELEAYLKSPEHAANLRMMKGASDG